jgi:acyl carrier protein
MHESVDSQQRTVDLSIYEHATNKLFANVRGLTIKRIVSSSGVTQRRLPASSEPVTVIALGESVPLVLGSQLQSSSELPDYLRRRLAEIIECDESEITLDRPLSSIGLDSLMAYELLHDLENNLGIRVPAGSFFGGMTLGNLIEYGEAMFLSRTTATPVVIDWVEGSL